MRKVDYLIADIREDTENEEFSETIGITDERIIGFLNEAQSRIQSGIIKQHPLVFVKEQYVDIIANKEVYTLPRNTFAANRVTQVEYQSANDEAYWYVLKPTTLKHRAPGADGNPCHYIRKTGSILLTPVPTTSRGRLRISYVESVPRLDKKRATVASVTTLNNQITSLFFDVSTDIIDSAELEKDNYFSVVDSIGTIKMQRVRFDSIDTTTGEITVNPNFLFEAGEEIAPGDIIVRGKYSTTHSQLDDYVEKYLISYANYKMLKRDSSVDYVEAMQELAAMESEIIDFYAEISDDIYYISDLQATDNDNWEW